MLPRATASRLSVLLSLGLILALVLAFADRPERQAPIAPAAVPPSDEPASAPARTAPRAVAAEPVVLPPPPAPVAPPRPKDATARAEDAPRSEPAPRQEPPAKKTGPKPPSVSVTGKADEPPSRKAEPKPSVARKPQRPTALEKPERPSRSARTRPAIEAATGEAPGTSIVAGRGDVAEGRTLLRLLEHGSGPAVELAWPETAGQRETLFALVSRCYGMRVALMDADDHLYVADGRPNTPWALNLDRYSGFIREPAGKLSREERKAAERIRAHHGGLVTASPVRVFPRIVDARLLGGLHRLVGGSYAAVQTIRARYRMNGRRLVVDEIVVDGRMIQGRVELRPVARGACRRLVQR